MQGNRQRNVGKQKQKCKKTKRGMQGTDKGMQGNRYKIVVKEIEECKKTVREMQGKIYTNVGK